MFPLFMRDGFTRRPLPLIERVDTPLAKHLRRELWMKEQREVDHPVRKYHLELPA